ncbi:TVP38/TMEM64 family protein [Streptomyces sp. NRRL S-350]|uniref:TVP38/TMEM64 family protein n=1 Tax=Streptomyces sp. NRRL S-350 TaxID=1463902 RepID=UPI00055F60A2|nr:VTT domain-containing protein [Streptomyces sp. NRRL S-350]
MSPPVAAPAPPAAPRSAWWRFALLIALLGAAGGSLLLWSPTDLLSGGLADRLPGYWFGPLFAVVYAVGTLAFVPRPALNAAAGLLLGIQQGVALAVLGTTVGAALAFGLGRTLGREALRPHLRGKVLGALDRRFTEQGFRSVLVLRLLPGMPFQAANYGAAFSGVRFLPFLLATAIGVVPTTAVYVTAAASADRPGSAAFLLSAGVIALLGLGTLVGLWRTAKGRRRATVG